MGIALVLSVTAIFLRDVLTAFIAVALAASAVVLTYIPDGGNHD